MHDPVSPQAAPTQAGFEALVDGAPSVYIISLSGTLSQTHYIRDGTHCRSGSRGCPHHVTQCSEFRHGVVLDDCDRRACIERPRRLRNWSRALCLHHRPGFPRVSLRCTRGSTIPSPVPGFARGWASFALFVRNKLASAGVRCACQRPLRIRLLARPGLWPQALSHFFRDSRPT